MLLKKKLNINDGLEEFRQIQHAAGKNHAVLVDVRNPDEYKRGHIPGSVNLPLNRLKSAGDVIPTKDTPAFLYCVTGARADRAVKRLKREGYTKVKSIGGVEGYRGEISRG